MTTVDMIAATGEALYGPRWRSPLSRAIQRPGAPRPGVSLRLFFHWIGETTERPAPAWVPAALADLLTAEATRRRDDLLELANKIRSASV